jgi:hypothetical protein
MAFPNIERPETPGLHETLPEDMHTLKGTGLTVPGVEGVSQRNNGVQGTSADSGASGVYGQNDGSGIGVGGRSMNGVGIFGEGKILAGRFIGDVEVTGDIRLLNADCAEDFDIFGPEPIEPGTVMVVGAEGVLHQSHQVYDKRVAGVISGAGGYKPGIVLDKQQSQSSRKPIALLGKVFCKVDASFSPVEVGDLLTTSDTPGHAMKAVDPLKAFGAVIGKALRPLKDGQGLIPILIALQ